MPDWIIRLIGGVVIAIGFAAAYISAGMKASGRKSGRNARSR